MNERRSSDKHRGLVRTRDLIHLRRRRAGSERGQATTEFALILFPLLIIVAGIIYFGIALNYWLDMQKVANQGARWAAVNCGQSASTPQTPNPCSPSGQTLQQTLKQQAVASGLQKCVGVQISFPSGQQEVGEPVRVQLISPFRLVPLIGVTKITLNASATMRLEQKPSAFDTTGNFSSPC